MSAPPWLQPLVDAVAGVDPETFLLRQVTLPDGTVVRRGDPPDDTRRAAVLVLFGHGPDGPDVLLIERSPHLRSHAGQPAFPGGRIDDTDDGPVGAALREAEEETGLDPAGVEVLVTLPMLWVPPSGNVVTPVLAWWREPSDVHAASAAEVSSVARVAVGALTDPANRLRVRHPSGYTGPAFRVAGMLVWGFTAGILDRLLALGGWERDWDRDRVEDLPADVVALLNPMRAAAGEG